MEETAPSPISSSLSGATTPSLAPSVTASPLPFATARSLSDRSYDKRKNAALEIELLVKKIVEEENGDKSRISSIILILTDDFIKNTNSNHRKGGLIGLAATSIGLMSETRKYLATLLPPVIHCFEDPESRVRYYACESLFNIAKVSRSAILEYFNEIFDGLCKLFADVDMDVRNGANMLDRLIKEIVTESETFNIEKFMPTLQKYVLMTSAYVRRLIITWITVLSNIPGIDMLDWLPDFLDGLFNMLSDANREIRQEADAMLCEFLEEIQDVGLAELDVGPIIKILVRQCENTDNFIRLTAVMWIKKFITIGGDMLIQFYADLLGSVLRCISDSEDEVKEAASSANDNLLNLVKSTKTKFELRPLVSKATHVLVETKDVPTRIASLRWISVLLEKCPIEMQEFFSDIFPVLLKTLSDSSDSVVVLDLEVLVLIANTEEHFQKVLSDIVSLFSNDRNLLEQRGGLILRNICVHLNSIKIYQTLSKILAEEKDLEFSSLMIQALNLILMTSSELQSMRTLLKKSFVKNDPQMKEANAVFVELYNSWCHNPIATFSLCLLAQAFDLSSALVVKFAELEVTLGFLMQIDKLIQLLESPVFIYLRIQLLDPDNEFLPDLFKSLYGLLMLLPQSAAYKTLKDRLDSASALHVALNRHSSNGSKKTTSKICSDLISQFDIVQKKHKRVSL